MATVGQGSPIQTIQYNAPSFESMAYAPQILSQKHEQMQQQLDVMDAAVPQNIPAEAVDDVKQYTSAMDDISSELAKSGYSFGMRNKLSGLRRTYNETIKPIESYNAKKAELNQLLNKAKMNPNLIPIYKMPTYGEFKQGATDYDFNVVSGADYEKYGLSKATQSATNPFSEVKNNMLVSGFRDQYHGMNAEEIKSAIMQDQDVVNKLASDGLTPNHEGFDIAIDRMVSGVMARKPVQNITPYNPKSFGITTGGKTVGDVKSYKVGTRVLDFGPEDTRVENLSSIISNPGATMAEKQVATHIKNMVNTELNKDINKDLKSKYDAVIKSKPTIQDNSDIKNNLKSIGLTDNEVNKIIDSWDHLTQRSINASSTASADQAITKVISEVIGENRAENLIGTKSYFNPTSAFSAEQVILHKDGVAEALQPLINKVNEYSNWHNDSYKDISEEIDNRITKNLQAQVPEYHTADATASAEWRRITESTVNNDESVINNVTEYNDKGESEVITSEDDRKEIFNKLMKSGTVSNVSISEPSGDKFIPPTIKVTGKVGDKSYDMVVTPNEANTLGIYNEFAKSSNNPEMMVAAQGYQAGNIIKNRGMIKPTDLGYNIDNLDLTPDGKDLISNSTIRKTSDNTYKIVANNSTINGIEYNTINQAIHVLNRLINSQIVR